MSTYVPSGVIYLLKDIKIDNTYQNEYYFRNIDDQMNFFDSCLFKKVENSVYQRKNSNQMILPFNADEIRQCNYLYWINEDTGKRYYAFVTSIDYENPNTSIIRYQLDVYQTYLFDMQWTYSYIEREHCKRFYDSGEPIPYLETEDIDFGDTYRTVNTYQIQPVHQRIMFVCFSFKRIEFGTAMSDWSSFLDSLEIVYVPFWIQSSATDLKYFTFNTTRLTSLMSVIEFFQKDSKYVNRLVSSYVTPWVPIDFDYEISGNTVSLHSSGYESATLEGETTTSHIIVIRAKNRNDTLYNQSETRTMLNKKYSYFPDYAESKLLMYPYSFMELTNDRGVSYIIRMEQCSSDRISFKILSAGGAKGKVAVIPQNYMGVSDGDIENALIDNSFDDLTIADDYSASYIQSNKNALEASKINATQTYLNSLETTQRTSTANYKNINATLETSKNTATATVATGALNVTVGAIGSLMGATSGINAMVGGAGDVIQGAVAYGNADITRQAQLALNDASSLNSVAVALTDYDNTVRSINAKINDAQQVPPTITNLGGQTLFDVAHNCMNYKIKCKTILPEYVDKLQSYFRMYGYKVNKLKIPQFRTRLGYNYIKMAKPNVYGNIPNDDLNIIKTIFTSGITLWHNPADIGDYSQSNWEI